MSNPETDWTNAYNYTIADEAEALKAHLNKVLHEVHQLRRENLGNKQLLKLWHDLTKSGEIWINKTVQKALVDVTERVLEGK
jgi:hypothetical protein